jgi:polyferredoxin
VGIDIRDGLQLECIGCSLCIDACDAIMVKVGRPKGLIAFDTDTNVQLRAEGKEAKINLVRPRTVIYTVLIAAIGGLLLYGLMTRSLLDMNVLRDRQPNYVRLSDGSIRNGYTVKVLNKATEPRTLTLAVDTLENPVISFAGHRDSEGYVMNVPADETRDFKIYITVPDVSALGQKADMMLILTDSKTGEITQTRAIFISGGPK